MKSKKKRLMNHARIPCDHLVVGALERDLHSSFDNSLHILGNFPAEKCLKSMQIILVKE